MWSTAPPVADSDAATFLKQAQGFCVATFLLIAADLIFVLVLVDDQLSVSPNSPKSTFSTSVMSLDIIALALAIFDFISTWVWLPKSGANERRYMLTLRSANQAATKANVKFANTVFVAFGKLPAPGGNAYDIQFLSAMADALQSKVDASAANEEATFGSAGKTAQYIGGLRDVCITVQNPAGTPSGEAWTALLAVKAHNRKVFESIAFICDGMAPFPAPFLQQPTALQPNLPATIAHRGAAIYPGATNDPRDVMAIAAQAFAESDRLLAGLPSSGELGKLDTFTQAFFTLATIVVISIRLSLGNQAVAGSATGASSVATTIGIAALVAGAMNGVLTAIGFKLAPTPK